MIRKLEDMCHDKNFNKEEAIKLMHQININQEFERDNKFGCSYPTTLQAEAIYNNNIEMLSLLLENGADPNQIYWDEESELWNLQYCDGQESEIDEIRLKMAQLLLDYGADPLVDPENTGEPLLDYVVDAVFNDDMDELWDYRSRFLILLIAFGAKSKYCIPRIVGEFDKTNMKQYEFSMVPEGNGKYSGLITDGQGNDVAYV